MAYIVEKDGTATCLECNAGCRRVAPSAYVCSKCRREAPQSPRRSIAATSPVPRRTGGPGTELAGILKSWLGITPSPTCSCTQMASKMDALGVEWCRSDAGMQEIIGVMRSEHAKRWQSGKIRLPWTDAGAKVLVLLACRKAKNRP